METVACNLCGSTATEFCYSKPCERYYPERFFDVVRCTNCGLGFTNPRPTLDEISDYYRDDFYEELEDPIHQRRFELESRFLPDIKKGEDPPLLLDVGCGPGAFARFMANKGWTVEGVEPFSTIPATDFPVHRAPFSTLEGMADRFDAVTAWAVFEHLHDPMSYFEKAAEVLKPGGRLVFLVTNFDSISSRYLMQEDVPRHLYFFREDNVREYLRKTGLEFVSSQFSGEIFPMGTTGAVQWWFNQRVLGKPYGWNDRPAAYRVWLEEKGLRASPISMAQFIAGNPVAFADRLAEPLVARWQLWRGTYGTATYVASRPVA